MTERRHFIKQLARGILLTGLTGMGAALVLRERKGAGEACDYDFICKNCRKKSGCELPEARAHRAQATTGN